MSVDSLAKVELHVHLEGTAPPELVARLAQRNGVTLPERLLNEHGRFHYDDFLDFLTYPLVAGRPTFLVGLLHLILAAAAAWLLARAGRALWRQRARWRDLVVGRDSPSAFTQNAALLGYDISEDEARRPLAQLLAAPPDLEGERRLLDSVRLG